VTGCPRLREVRMDASRARSARSDAVLVHPLAVAIDATRSALVKAGISFTTGWNRVRMLAEVALEGQAPGWYREAR